MQLPRRWRVVPTVLLWVKEVLLALMLAPLSDYGWQLEICRCAWTLRDAALRPACS